MADDFFGKIFDLNGDGKLDSLEKGMQFAAFSGILDEDTVNDDSDIDEDDELEMNGLDRDELELMDEDERRDALEDAGLDPDDFDF